MRQDNHLPYKSALGTMRLSPRYSYQEKLHKNAEKAKFSEMTIRAPSFVVGVTRLIYIRNTMIASVIVTQGKFVGLYIIWIVPSLYQRSIFLCTAAGKTVDLRQFFLCICIKGITSHFQPKSRCSLYVKFYHISSFWGFRVWVKSMNISPFQSISGAFDCYNIKCYHMSFLNLQSENNINICNSTGACVET